MPIEQTLAVLGYDRSPNFLRSGQDNWASAPDYAHIFRKAVEKCSLRGVYVLRPSPNSRESIVPVVYACEAPDEASADKIHRLVWNQNIVPFLLVETPRFVRLYTGFRYPLASHETSGDPVTRGILAETVAFNEIAKRLADLRSDSVDEGRIWKKWGEEVTPRTRVDLRLLGHLEALNRWLRQSGLDRGTSHALIGKFVYLQYLRHRDILSDRKLARWGISPASLFSREATLESFGKVIERLDAWLNGDVFPLSARSIRLDHLRKVAGVFSGDTPRGQLHLDFQAYDFSFIPIETLSAIYEQFLHMPEPNGQQSRGRESGAYYTPIPLVNFMLGEMDAKHRLKEGMRVLDPACGSGAFLVQCYRRLIERKKAQQGNERLRPRQLRDLLTNHVFGVDRDGDACQVAELSLILTLLDYVQPPDLENSPTFQLPALRGRNIFEADFFDPDSDWAGSAERLGFDWVVGNPPWKSLNSESVQEEDKHALGWIGDHASRFPVGGNQLAEAFAWKVLPHLRNDGVVGLLLPAMTLFKNESKSFRRKLFSCWRVWCVANFANLAYVLFAGRAERPAAAFFYRPSTLAPTESAVDDPQHASIGTEATDRTILTYTPFVVNQEANRPQRSGRNKHTWAIIVNASEMREVRAEEAATGSRLPWKLGMWGSYRDARLLDRIRGKFPTFKSFATERGIKAHEGAQLRNSTAGSTEQIEFVSELVGKKRIDFRRLRGCGRIFAFPENAILAISASQAHLRIRGGRAGIEVSRPPHIILDAGRRFAVYSDEFIAVPARQIGIAGPRSEANLLRALSLYLSSSFATYHQFFMSPEWGIDTTVATLDALQDLPVPLNALPDGDLVEWSRLQQRLASADASVEQLAARVDAQVFDLIGLREAERMLVQDLVNVRMQLVKGKVTKPAIRAPSVCEMQAYLRVLGSELDSFVEAEAGLRHEVAAVYDDMSAMVAVGLCSRRRMRSAPLVLDADAPKAEQFRTVRENLRRKHSQWVYFDRGLRVYDGSRTYLFKPMQRLHWTKTQALLDAGEVIADTLAEAED